MKIEMKTLGSLKRNPMNPKEHDEDLLHKSLSTFGYVEPIVMDERTGYMISGHGRQEVLQNLFDEGSEPPEGIEVQNGEWMVPVVSGWASQDDTEVHAVLVALNRTTERGGWNDSNLLAILQSLSEHDLLDVTGYVDTDIAVLQKVVEAQDVFVSDLDSVIDEFLDDNGLDRDPITLTYSSALRVYFQTEEARQDFYDAIGYGTDTKAKMIRYPKSFERKASDEWTG